MRKLWFPLAAALVALSVPTLVGQTPDAVQVMSSAREALGGEKKLSAVRTFTATGVCARLLGWRVEAPGVRRFADHVAFHRLQQIVARRIGRQIQFRVQCIELEHVVMEGPRAGARSEVGARVPAASRDARTVAGPIRQVAWPQTLRQPFGSLATDPVPRSGRPSIYGHLRLKLERRRVTSARGQP